MNYRYVDHLSCLSVIGSTLLMVNAALGADATGELDVEAGIDSAITVKCTQALSFGTTTFNSTTALDTEMNITVDENGSLTATDAPELSALGDGQAGECTLFNATSSNETEIEVSYSETSDLQLTGRDGVMGLNNAGDPSDKLLVTLDKPSDIVSEVNSDGEATFKVTGTLKVPTNGPSNPGGYGYTIDVTVNDSP